MANKKKETGAKTKKPVKKSDDSKIVKFEKKKPAANFDGNITSIKIPVKKEIPLITYKKTSDRGTKEVTFKDGGCPLDSFIAAMQNLCPYFLNIVEIPNKTDETIITGVSFSKTGIVITGQIELTENDIKTPLIVNSPHVNLESDCGGYTVPEYAKELIAELKRQAVLYMEGESAEKQMELDGIK